MFSLTDPNRRFLLRAIVCIFFAIGISLSFDVWHSDRLFPICPVVDGFPVFPLAFDAFVPLLLMGLLCVGVLIRNPWYFRGLLVCFLFVLLQDQMRWQPWVYIYVFLLIPFAIDQRKFSDWLPYFQIILIGVYLWSGLHKIGPGFNEGTFDKMLEELVFIEDSSTREKWQFLGYLIPIFEVLIAIGLLFKKTRLPAIIGVVITHTTILIYLINAGHNSVVYPWNVAMVLLTFTAFNKTEANPLQVKNYPNLRVSLLNGLAALLFLVMPVFNLFGMWDNYLSFKLYSGTNGQYCIGLDQTQYEKVDPALREYFWAVEQPQGKYWIFLSAWCYDELNIPFYPEHRVFKKVGATFCSGTIPKTQLEFVKFKTYFNRKDATVFSCEDCE